VEKFTVRLVLLFLASVATANVSSTSIALRRTGCLFVTSGSSATRSGCSGDRLHLANQATTKHAIEAYGVSSLIIKFVGCDSVDFQTEQLDDDGTTNEYHIYYPVLKDRLPAAYTAPLIHELAHVYQLESAGSYQNLIDQLKIKRIELGADFLTGVIFKLLGSEVDLDEFQHNVNVGGKYYESDADAHGTPEQRMAAFRYGYTQHDEHFGSNVNRANSVFQADIYGEVIAP
jgi:hypothetical protein